MGFGVVYADVAELVDAPDLGSGAERRGGSSPFIRTTSGLPILCQAANVLCVIGARDGVIYS
jgi:hypothetical protein